MHIPLFRRTHQPTGLILSLCFVVGCASIMTRNVDRADLCRFQESPASRSDVERVLGKPFATGTINGMLSAHYRVRRRGVQSPAPGRSPWQCPYDEKYQHVVVFYTASGIVSMFSPVTSGGRIQGGLVDKLKKGVSTRHEARLLYGDSNQTHFESDGSIKDIWLYGDSISDDDMHTKGRQSSRNRSVSTLQSKYQRLALTFDSKGILQNVVNDDSNSVMKFNSDMSRRRLALFDIDTVNQMKRKRPSRDQVVRLLGDPDSTTQYDSGDCIYVYLRCQDDMSQSVHVRFSSSGMAKTVNCTQSFSATQKPASASKSVHVFAQSLRLAFLLAGRTSKIAPSTYIGDTARKTASVSGEQIDQAKLQSLAVGKSTPADLVDALGLPDSVEWSELGLVKSYGYQYSRIDLNTGIMASSSTQYQMVTMSFDDKGRLSNIKVDDMSHKM